jgi:twinkle protein
LRFKTQGPGKEIILRQCPFCGDERFHFYISREEGNPFFCHKCQEAGNLISLQKHLGDYEAPRRQMDSQDARRVAWKTIKPAFPEKESVKGLDAKIVDELHQRLLNDGLAMGYLTGERGITLETIEAFNLGLQDQKGVRWLAIPHFRKGKLVNIKFRSLPPAEKAFRRVEGCPSVLFNADVLAEEEVEEVFLCEGEIDTMTLWQAGIQNAVGLTEGAGTLLPEWVDQLATVKKIFLCYDGDEAGQKGAREAGRRLGYDRCFNVVLPDGQDVNDFFQEHDVFDFYVLADSARQFDVSGVMSIEEGLEKFRAEGQKYRMDTGLRTPWDNVNQRIKTGLQPGELIVLSAPPKIGKSNWALQVATFNALQEIPSLFLCLEMRPMKIIEKIIQCQTQQEILGPEEIVKVRRDFMGKPLYLGYCYQKPSLDQIIETLRAAIQRYGLKLVVFDHLHFLCRSITNQVQEISLAVQAFKFLAEEMEVPIILIAQPRKIQPDSIMTAMDLKDSISIYTDCDHLIILHRKRKSSSAKEVEKNMEIKEEAFEPITLVRVEASRYNAGGEALLYYHGEYSRFEEI